MVFWLLKRCVDGVLGRENAHCATVTALRTRVRPLCNGHDFEAGRTPTVQQSPPRARENAD